jgi:hypothetical protein
LDEKHCKKKRKEIKIKIANHFWFYHFNDKSSNTQSNNKNELPSKPKRKLLDSLNKPINELFF